MMMSRHLEASDLAGISQGIEAGLAASQLLPQAIYLHGSRGTKWQREESDWDFAILAAERITWEQRLSFLQAISPALQGAPIDLADLRQCDTVFAAHVVSEGDAIYVGDEAARQQYEMLVLAKYARLNEERQGILNDIRQRGTVYQATGQA